MNKGTRRLAGISLAVTLAVSAVVFAKTLFFSPRRGAVIRTDSSGDKEWKEKPEEKIEEKAVKVQSVQEVRPSEPEAEAKPESENTAEGEKININTATAAVLEQLPGIGEYLAETIVDYRSENGNFEKTEDIMKVSGIGPAKYKAIADFISVEAR